MGALSQSELPLVISYRAVLVDVNTAMQILGVSQTSLMRLVDDGTLLWTFDVAPVRDNRAEWRFWLGELVAPAQKRDLTPERAMSSIVGHEICDELSARTVGDILLLRPQSVLRLVRTGQLDGRINRKTRWITRGSVIKFISHRWVGAQNKP
jgi:hypothetical protein